MKHKLFERFKVLFLFPILKPFCHLLPIQNKVIFDNFNGRGMGDDPKYIAEELLKRRIEAKYYWIVEDKKESLPEGITPLKKNSLYAFYHISTAKVWISNIRGSFSMALKKKRNYYINTWHSTLSLKKLGTDNIKSTSKAKKRAQQDMKLVDLMYSNSTFRVNKYKTTFWYEGEVVKMDVPRVSCMYHQPEGLKHKVCQYLNIPSDRHIVMYAPTFRDYRKNDISVYSYDFLSIIRSLEVKFGGHFVMLLRLHPHLRNSPLLKSFNFSDTIINASAYPDMEELLCITDILLTDFSSSMFDHSIAKKIVFLLAKDYTEYIQKERELYFDPKKDLPFGLYESELELVNAIANFNKQLYDNRCNEFYKSIGLSDSGNGDKMVADIVERRLKI